MTGFGWAFLALLLSYLVLTAVLIRTWPWFTPIGVGAWVAFIALCATALIAKPRRR